MKEFENFVVLGLCLMVVSCSNQNQAKYEDSLRKVKRIAVPGAKVSAVYKELKEEGWDVAEPYSPSEVNPETWMNVQYGYVMTFSDTLHMSLGEPAAGGPPASILIRGESGVVRSVE